MTTQSSQVLVNNQVHGVTGGLVYSGVSAEILEIEK